MKTSYLLPITQVTKYKFSKLFWYFETFRYTEFRTLNRIYTLALVFEKFSFKSAKNTKIFKKIPPTKITESIACGYSKVFSRGAWISTIFAFAKAIFPFKLSLIVFFFHSFLTCSQPYMLRFKQTNIALIQASRDTTLEYPHAILSITFLVIFFGILAFLNILFSKTRANLEIMFSVLNWAHLNASKLVEQYKKVSPKRRSTIFRKNFLNIYSWIKT